MTPREKDLRDAARRELLACRAENARLKEALRNTMAILLTYDVAETHGVVIQARAALTATEPTK